MTDSFLKLKNEISGNPWIIWFEIPAEEENGNSKRVRLHNKIYGYKDPQGKRHNGLLEQWNGKKRKENVPYMKIDQMTYLVGGDTATKLEEIGRNLEVITRAAETTGIIYGNRGYTYPRRRR